MASGIGTNKAEAKKDASKNCLKVVAPNIYKVMFKDENTSNNQQIL